MKHFFIGPKDKPTLAEIALMSMVDLHEAFPHTVRVKDGEELFFYKLIV